MMFLQKQKYNDVYKTKKQKRIKAGAEETVRYMYMCVYTHTHTLSLSIYIYIEACASYK